MGQMPSRAECQLRFESSCCFCALLFFSPAMAAMGQRHLARSWARTREPESLGAPRWRASKQRWRPLRARWRSWRWRFRSWPASWQRTRTARAERAAQSPATAFPHRFGFSHGPFWAQVPRGDHLFISGCLRGVRKGPSSGVRLPRPSGKGCEGWGTATMSRCKQIDASRLCVLCQD